MTYPTVSPGVVTPPMNALEQKVTQLEQRLDELSRRDLTNAIVGQGGTFRATLEADGVAVFEIGAGRPEYGSKQVLIMRDQVGNEVYHTDELAGYGLSAPLFTYFMGTRYPGTTYATNAAGVEVETALVVSKFYNPAVYVGCLVAMTGGWSGRFKITNGDTSVFSSSTSFTNAQYCSKVLLLPAEYVGAQGVTLSFLVTPAVASSTVTFPQFCAGQARSFYDLNPAYW